MSPCVPVPLVGETICVSDISELVSRRGKIVSEEVLSGVDGDWDSSAIETLLWFLDFAPVGLKLLIMGVWP